MRILNYIRYINFRIDLCAINQEAHDLFIDGRSKPNYTYAKTFLERHYRELYGRIRSKIKNEQACDAIINKVVAAANRHLTYIERRIKESE